MKGINEFIDILDKEFINTCFAYIYDSVLDLHQILHNNFNIEKSAESNAKIAFLLNEYFFSKNFYNIMVCYDFYNEMNVITDNINDFTNKYINIFKEKQNVENKLK